MFSISYKSMLKMRCQILEATETQVDGIMGHFWAVVVGAENAPCFLDLNYIRAGKDPTWTPDTGTAENRSGVLFLGPNTPAAPGNRVRMLQGPSGTFLIESSLDEAWTPKRLHHLECYVTEVDRALSGQGVNYNA